MQAVTDQSPSPALSLVQGSTEPKLFHLTLGQLADRQAELYGSKDAVIVGWSNARLTYRELNERSKRLARGLLAMGISKGDRVAILSGDDERFVELFFAAGRIGAVLVIINKTYTIPECEHALRHTGKLANPAVLFLSDNVDRRRTAPMLDHIKTRIKGLKRIVTTRWDDIPNPPMTWNDVLSQGDTTDAATLQRVEDSVDPYSVVNIQFTSGTTGSPKAAMLSHFNVTNNGFFIGSYLEITPEDVICCGPPLFHCFGLVAGLMASFTHGSSIIFAARDFEAPAVVGMLIKEKATVLHGVPTMFTAVLQELEKSGRQVRTIRKGIAAGTKVPPAILTELEQKLGYEHIAITYGMTETAPASFMTKVSDTHERRLETVGQVFPHVQAKIVDGNNRIVPRGVRGEVCVAGWLLQAGYFRNPEKTAEVMIRDEKGTLWMHTGDEGVLDEEGYLRITGRIKDIIIRGGENIYPLEIEERLLQHPAISVASVVGVKDSKYGEAVTAFLQLRPGQTKPSLGEMKTWLAETLARHKAPTRAFWVGQGEIVDSFPVTGTGKIRKEVLREIGDKIIAQQKGPSSKL